MTPPVSQTVPRSSQAAPPAKPSPALRVIVWLIVIIVLGGLGFGLYHWTASPSAVASGKRHGGPEGGLMQVVVAKAYRGDMPIYVDALGTVTPLNTVTVRSRVDGELMKVTYKEGQIVHAGDVLAEIDPRPYQAQLLQAQGQILKDQALLKNAQADLERYTTARETVSQQQIDTAQAGVAQYEGAIKIDQGAIDSANLQLTYCHITAPLTGKIGLRSVDAGNIVHASDTTGMAVITQIQPIAVVFNLPEGQLPSVLSAMKGDQKLSVDVFSSDRSVRLASGQLKAIDNQIDATTATVRIKAVFNNEDQMLYPNQFVNVRLKVQTLKSVVLAPTASIQRSPDTMYVYVVKADNSIDLRPVTVGPAEGGVTVVENGLKPGETVITEGVDKLAPGMKVVPHNSATSQPAERSAGSATQPGAHPHSSHGARSTTQAAR